MLPLEATRRWFLMQGTAPATLMDKPVLWIRHPNHCVFRAREKNPLGREPRDSLFPRSASEGLLEALGMGNLATAAVVLDEFGQQAVSDLRRVQKCLADNVIPRA